MSLIRYNNIQLEACKLVQQEELFERLLNDYLTDSAIPSIDKVELTDWLEAKGIKWN